MRPHCFVLLEYKRLQGAINLIRLLICFCNQTIILLYLDYVQLFWEMSKMVQTCSVPVLSQNECQIWHHHYIVLLP